MTIHRNAAGIRNRPAATRRLLPIVVLLQAAQLVAVDFFLKLTTDSGTPAVQGESLDAVDRDESGLTAWLWNWPAEVTDLSKLHLLKQVDRSTPGLMQLASNGGHVARAHLTVRKPGSTGIPSEFYFMNFGDVAVTAVRHSGDTTHLSEQVSIGFRTVHVVYVQLDANPNTRTNSFYWDVALDAGGVSPPASGTPDTDGDGNPDNSDPDDDNDGIPDSYETENGLNAKVLDGDLDTDEDGLTNLEEFLVGTRADSKDSVFKATLEMLPGQPMASLAWPSVEGKRYEVSFGDCVQGPFLNFGTFDGSNTGRTTIKVPLTESMQFFRVLTLP